MTDQQNVHDINNKKKIEQKIKINRDSEACGIITQDIIFTFFVLQMQRSDCD